MKTTDWNCRQSLALGRFDGMPIPKNKEIHVLVVVPKVVVPRKQSSFDVEDFLAYQNPALWYSPQLEEDMQEVGSRFKSKQKD